MSRSCSLPTHCLLLLLGLAAGAAAQPSRLGVNELFREGFEGDLSKWKIPGELIEDAQAAHTGAKCVRGATTGPDQGIRFTRQVPLDPSRVYTLAVWARSQKRCRLALWAVKPPERVMIGIVKSTGRNWKPYRFSFNPTSKGNWTIEVIAPSSYGGAPVGEMFVDDVVFAETIMPPTDVLSTDQPYAQYPALDRGPDGAAYAVWQAFADGKDSLWAARLTDLNSGSLTVAQRWEISVPGAGYTFRPAVAVGVDGALVAAAVEVEGNWNVYAWPLDAQGPGKRVELATTAATELRPALAYAGSTLWATWVSNEGGFRAIYAAAMRDGKLGPARRLSAANCSNYTPSIAATDNGRVWVAWSSFRGGKYDLWLNHFDGAKWQGEQRLTDNPLLEHRPVLAASATEQWIAWEAAEYTGYRTNALAKKRVFVARLTPTGLQSPKQFVSGLTPWIEKPALTADPTGRLWLTVRRSRGQNGAWDAVLHAVDSPAPGVVLSAQPGRARAVSMAATRSKLLVALQADNYGRAYPDEEAAKEARSEVRLAPIALAEMPARAQPEMAPLDFGRTELNTPGDRETHGEELPAQTIEYNGETLRLYYGDFHDHSDISQCNRRGDSAPNDNYAHNRDIHRLDFAAVTDHGYNITEPLWQLTAELARANTDPGRFLAFLGEEWTSTFEEYSEKHPFGFYGHRNLIFADPYFPRWFNAKNRWTPRQVWNKLRQMRANFVQIPHQLADDGNVPTDWDFTDEVAQPVAEIWQTRGSYEYRGAPGMARRVVPRDGYFMQDAWARGIVIGVIASPDHGGGRGKAAVFAPSLDRPALLDAVRQRHTFGTSGARVFVDFRVNGKLMGEKLPRADGPVTIQVKVIAPQEIQSVDICRSNQFVYSKPDPGKTCEFTYRDDKPLNRTSYYYCRVIQKDGQLAWTSPVWLGAP